ncbi:MAG: DUF4129 domain-containing protein, partial [Pseudomonadota bacterium]|nr:DUF4129 domain-containing protein [Pseudomonadota bacterium]
ARALPRRNPLGAVFDVERDAFLARLRFELGAVNNGWNQWVLNYTPERQRGVVEALESHLSDWRVYTALALGALLLAGARALRKRRRGDPIDALYSALCLQLGRLGLARGADEGPNDYRLRVDISRLSPPQKNAAAQFLRLYSAYKYGAQPSVPGLAATLKSLLTKFR